MVLGDGFKQLWLQLVHDCQWENWAGTVQMWAHCSKHVSFLDQLFWRFENFQINGKCPRTRSIQELLTIWWVITHKKRHERSLSYCYIRWTAETFNLRHGDYLKLPMRARRPKRVYMSKDLVSIEGIASAGRGHARRLEVATATPHCRGRPAGWS